MKRRDMLMFALLFPLLYPCALFAKSKVRKSDDDSVGLRIAVFKDKQVMRVIVVGRVYVWPVSTGRHGHETPTGTFTPPKMEKMHRSSIYPKDKDEDEPGAAMPYCIFITENYYRIHGTDEEALLRRPVSHGCVRLSMEHAKKLFELAELYGLANTRISIYERYAKG